MGIHFMNPVPVMKLVELVRGIATDEKTFSAAKEFVGTLEKTITVAEDFPAFIVNRILLPMINEAIYTLYEGVGTVDAIDTAMKLGANHPMGPLQLADFIGLDTCLSIMQVLHDGLADSKYRPCPLLVKYVEAGWLDASPAAASMTIAVKCRSRRGKHLLLEALFSCRRVGRSRPYDPIAPLIKALASSLSQAAGPFIAEIRHPLSSISSVTGSPMARPSFFRLLNTEIVLSR